MSEIIEYEAFISYKHNSIDDKVATDVQKCIEHYKIPKELQKKTGIRRFRKVFRDTTELSVTEDLSSDIELALKNSNFLIVICSERTSSTPWVKREIEMFLQYHDKNHILTVLVDGKPKEVIPDILQKEETAITDSDGNTIKTEKKLDPLPCDYRKGFKKARREEIPRIISRMLDCNYDELIKRESRDRQKRYFTITAITFCLSSIAILYLLWSNFEIRRNYRESIRQKAVNTSALMNDYLDKGHRIAAIKLGIESVESLKEDELSLAPELLKELEEAIGLYDCGYDGRFDNVVNTQEFLTEATVTEMVCDNSGKYICCSDRNNNYYIFDIENQLITFQMSLPDNYVDSFVTDDGLAIVALLHKIFCIDCETGELLWEHDCKSAIIQLFQDSAYKIGIVTYDSLSTIDINTSGLLEEWELIDLLPEEVKNNSQYTSIGFERYSGMRELFFDNNTKSDNGFWLLLEISANKRDILEKDRYIGLLDIQKRNICLLDNQWFIKQNQHYEPDIYIANDGSLYFTDISANINETSRISKYDAADGLVWSNSIDTIVPPLLDMKNGVLTYTETPNIQFGLWKDDVSHTPVLISVIGSSVLLLDPSNGEIINRISMPSKPSLYTGKDLSFLLFMEGIIGWRTGQNDIYYSTFPFDEFQQFLFIEEGFSYTHTNEYVFSVGNGIYIFQTAKENQEIVTFDSSYKNDALIREQFITNDGLVQIRTSDKGTTTVQKYTVNDTVNSWSTDLSGRYADVIGNPRLDDTLYIRYYDTDIHSSVNVAKVNLKNGDTSVFELTGNHSDLGEYINNRLLLGGHNASFLYCSEWTENENKKYAIYEYNTESEILEEHNVSFEPNWQCAGFIMSGEQLICFSKQKEVYVIDKNDWKITLLETDLSETDFYGDWYGFEPKEDLFVLYKSGGEHLHIIAKDNSINYEISSPYRIMTANYEKDTLYVLFENGVLGSYRLSDGLLIDTINLENDFFSYDDLSERILRDKRYREICCRPNNELIIVDSFGVYVVDKNYMVVRTYVPTAIGYDYLNNGLYLSIYDLTSQNSYIGWVTHYSDIEVIEKAKQMIPS